MQYPPDFSSIYASHGSGRPHLSILLRTAHAYFQQTALPKFFSFQELPPFRPAVSNGSFAAETARRKVASFDVLHEAYKPSSTHSSETPYRCLSWKQQYTANYYIRLCIYSSLAEHHPWATERRQRGRQTEI